MPRITLRPTTAADLPRVIGEPLPWRIRAITALADDRIIGLGGLAFPPDGPAIAFVQLAPSPDGIPEARRYPVAFHRAGLMAMEMIRASGVARVIATADAGSTAAVRWLQRLGFVPAERQPIAGRALFVWTRPQEGIRRPCPVDAGQSPAMTAPLLPAAPVDGAAPDRRSAPPRRDDARLLPGDDLHGDH